MGPHGWPRQRQLLVPRFRSFVMAGAGCRVVMFERSPVVAALLQDALGRLAAAPEADAQQVASRMQLHVADSCSLGDAFHGERERPDVCLLDPMFPPKTKKALVKKDMQVLQSLFQQGVANSATNTDDDAAKLFATAAAFARSKVVVKRPIKGDTLVPVPKPTHSLRGRSNRFDVYAVGPALAKALSKSTGHDK
eukprot:TRINITY_DN10266_c0_g1_i3.p1 TRINITY_DN10266_c0_g1~~TRINITY_DN10266_c0_g1_i3.p1  ORF type:complete len:194 (+),score=40.00 TRINITY_DN10266_c0_g1_i3:414-995(+)